MTTIIEVVGIEDDLVIAMEIAMEIARLILVAAEVAIAMEEIETTEPGETIPMIKAGRGEKVLLTPSPVADAGTAVTAVQHTAAMRIKNRSCPRCVFLYYSTNHLYIPYTNLYWFI